MTLLSLYYRLLLHVPIYSLAERPPGVLFFKTCMTRNRKKKNQEEKAASLELLALTATKYIGSLPSLILHSFFFVGIFSLSLFGFGFDQILLLLTTVVSLEAIYLSIFIQMTVNHQSLKIAEVSEDVEDIVEDIEGISEDVEEISKDIDDIQEEVGEISGDVEELGEEIEKDDQEDAKEHALGVEKIEKIEALLSTLLQEIKEIKERK